MARRAGVLGDTGGRIQNRAKSEVSAVHYDQYDYLPEKKAAMDVWNIHLAWMLASRPGAAALP